MLWFQSGIDPIGGDLLRNDDCVISEVLFWYHMHESNEVHCIIYDICNTVGELTWVFCVLSQMLRLARVATDFLFYPKGKG